MSDLNKARIISARDSREIDPSGKTKTSALYEYTIGDLGPFVFKVPIEEDSPEKLREAIAAKRAIIEAQEK